MTQDEIRKLSDTELTQVVAGGQEEQKARAERRKQEAIAKIKELAGAVGVSISIAGVRGRPVKVRGEQNATKSEKLRSRSN